MSGSLEVIVGPMYAGKSEELIRRIRRAEIAKQKVIVFKPAIDDRYDDANVVTHHGIRMPSFSVHNSYSIMRIWRDYLNPSVVGIDEIQFFNEDPILDVVEQLVSENARVIVSGLDQTYRGGGFGVVPELMARADEVLKLTAICQVCGGEATMTQRLLNGKPAPYDMETVIVGAEEQYEARCRSCHGAG